MQGLWSRTGLVSHTCHCVSCVGAGTNAVSGRAASAASRRRLYLGNSVTALYSSIFATAMFWNTEVKDKQQKEWKKKIEAVKEEVKLLQEEETRLVEAWAVRRKERQLALPLQKRHYSTTVGASTAEFGIYEETNSPQVGSIRRRNVPPTIPHTRPDFVTDALDIGLEESDTVDIFSDEIQPDEVDLSSEDVLRERAVQHLAMKQLAIKLLLRPSIAHSYGGAPQIDRRGSSSLMQIPTNELLRELYHIKRRIRQVKFSRTATFSDLATDMGIRDYTALVKERREMHVELQEDFRKYQENELSLPKLLLKVVNHLLHSEEPIPPATVELLITQFTRAKQNDVTKMVMESLFPNYFFMTLPVIVSTINFFNKTRDLFAFDGFLRLLQGYSSAVNIPRLWGSVTVGDVEVPVPPKPHHPFVMNALISAALSFDQPQRADAWLHVLRQTGYREGIVVVGSYLRFYSVQANWTDGRHTLLRALSYILSTKAHVPTSVERLILYMVIYCNVCGKRHLSDIIVENAVRCGLDWKQSLNKRDIRYATRNALRQWREASEVFPVDVPKDLSLGQKCHQFATRVEGLIRKTVLTDEPSKDTKPAPKVNRSTQKDKISDGLAEFLTEVADTAFHPKPVKKSTANEFLDIKEPFALKIDKVSSALNISSDSMAELEIETEKTSHVLREMNRLQPSLSGRFVS